MSEKKIVVPDGMLKAVKDRYDPNYPGAYRETFRRADLEVALRWRADNPIRPSSQQIQAMSDEMKAEGDLYQSVEAYCEKWARWMFFEPEAEIDRVDFYIKTSDGAYVPWVPSESQKGMVRLLRDSVLHENSSTIPRPREPMRPNDPVYSPEPEVPEEIADLMLKAAFPHSSEINRCILEAFRLGQKAGPA
jgi:hypothetical protein